MSRWQQMDESRRRSVTSLYRAFWIWGSLLAVLGVVVAAIGLLLTLVVGFWWALWIGIGLFALRLLTWFVGGVGTFGIAAAQAEEAAKRFLADRDEQETQ